MYIVILCQASRCQCWLSSSRSRPIIESTTYKLANRLVELAEEIGVFGEFL